MLSEVMAARFIKRMGNGRTLPCLIECENDHGEKIEIVVKYSGNLFEKEKSLAFEAIAAMLAADLGLPIPEPFLVTLDDAFISLVPDDEVRSVMQKSCRLGFGLRLVTGYAAWLTGQTVPRNNVEAAAEIAIFDKIIENSDRRPENPNCQFLADDFLIFDHELAFTRELFWIEPWEDGGFDVLEKRDHHIFARPYYEAGLNNLSHFIGKWEGLDANRFQQYKTALPSEWLQNSADVEHIDRIVSYLMQVKSNIQVIAKNALKVLR
ncbi:MAG TPA: HipA family kinase [Burkholderiaceae bacterium]